MKRFLSLFVLVFMFVFLLASCSPVAQGLMELPDEGRNLIMMIITAGATWVLLKLSEVFHVELSGWANAIAAALAPIFVTIIESRLQLIPPVFDNLVLSIIHLLVLLVGSLGVFFLAKRKAPSLR